MAQIAQNNKASHLRKNFGYTLAARGIHGSRSRYAADRPN